MKLSLRLLSAAAFMPLASADYETIFTFKDTFYLKFIGLSVGLGPADGQAILDGLDAQVDAFKTVWENKINELQDGECRVVGDVPTPKFSYCAWKYPDKYDVDRLPLAGECHEHGGEVAGGDDRYIQRLFYKIKDLKVRCPNKLPMKDLNRSELIEAALEEMLPALNINTANPDGPWEEASDVVEVKSNDECNAPLSINRFTKIEVNLKCLKEEVTVDKADMLKDALDEYFELYAVPKIKDAVESVTPMSAVYSVKSPYDEGGDTVYCYYPSYYSDGRIVDQYTAGDGNIVTKFKCGFDIVWFKDKAFQDTLLPNMVETVQKVFIDDTPPFLEFLQQKYPEESWIQSTQECGVIDTNILDPPTPNPTTASPTEEPTQSPTNAPTTSPTQKPTAAPTGSPSISSSESPSNSPSTSSGPTAPTDTSSPTQSPTTAAPTNSPTNSPTSNPTSAPTSSPTASPTSNPTKTPTASPVVVTILEETTGSPVSDECITNTNVTEEESPFVTPGSGTCGGGEIGDGICATGGECCSKWGWCGTTPAHCDDTAPTDFPIDPNAGKCGSGDGIVGDETCSGENECCSAWGYCGTGDQYCSVTIDTRTNESSEGKCGGGGVNEGECFNDGDCCSEYGFCGSTPDYCTGVQPRADSGDIDTAGNINPAIPTDLMPTMGYRCGKTETDARSNCKKTCTHARGDNNGNGPCEDDEECWGVQLNYCNTFDEGTHPICTDLDRANTVSRCGLDEASARGHCGQTCDTNDECPGFELCFDVMENLCDCHLENLFSTDADMPLPNATGDVNDAFFDRPTGFPTREPAPSTDGGAVSSGDQGIPSDEEETASLSNPFSLAKSKIMPYFVKAVGEGSVEGLSRDSASFRVNMSVAVVTIVSLNALCSYFM